MKHYAWQIRVPASTANLGPGFDSIGIALDRYLTIKVYPSCNWKVNTLAPFQFCFPTDERNLIVKTALRTAQLFDYDLHPHLIEVESEIPAASGLGSSAAAIVAGIELANLVGKLGLSRKKKLELAAKFEGHADNVGASLYGGLVVTSMMKDNVELQSIPDLDFRVIVVTPTEELKTEVSREILPEWLRFSEAVDAGTRSNLLIAALCQKDWPVVGRMMRHDLYHQPYRKPIIPHYEKVEEIADNHGAFGVALSGAGPTIACFVEHHMSDRLLVNLTNSFPDMEVQQLSIEEKGVTLLPVEPYSSFHKGDLAN
ncbi:homoserine kinase [Pseudalkalibacillus berkeleyi]|uniref:Homoserine kinase n=1 Tax=Pseudalkalibacillus berkeleyi TaxID=1069813 RepID=A0ABS9H6L0_9BACL|nr:homoserine kinase [Pseudalkalibacillus berkeleyi]MCF6139620.1 homoserine kinase [Pseudalkalibacillus berkeleyi]